MKLLTFIVDRAGGTYCSQHAGKDYEKAAQRFVDYAMFSEYLNAGSPDKERLLENMQEAVALEGLVNAFGASYLDDANEGWCITVTETVPPKSERREA